MTVFYVIRHAESDYNLNHSHLIGGRSNGSPLSPKGETQAEKLGIRLKNEGVRFTHCIASPAVRTQETAKRVFAIVNPAMTIVTEDRIQELEQGEWEGKERALIYTPEMRETINSDNWNFKSPQGESQREVEERMYDVVTSWQDQTGEDVVAIVTHGVAIKCLLRKFMDATPKMTMRMDIENTSLTVIHRQDNRWSINRFNDHAHLTIK